MGGEAFGHLLFESKGSFSCIRLAEEIVYWLYVALCAAHLLKTSTCFCEIV
jgi:hypothetical protein